MRCLLTSVSNSAYRHLLLGPQKGCNTSSLATGNRVALRTLKTATLISLQQSPPVLCRRSSIVLWRIEGCLIRHLSSVSDDNLGSPPGNKGKKEPSSPPTAADALEPKTKVEQTLELLKEEIARESESAQPSPKSGTVAVVKPPILTRVKNEIVHYYHGFRLMFVDIRVSSRYLWQVLRGKTLSRRERQQLIRTVSDLFRLLPFMVFIIIPFMEFLLPVYLKLFPGMLPSTFAEVAQEREKIRRKLKVRIEMAKFLQDTLEELSLERIKKDGSGKKGMAGEFSQFMKTIRTEGGYVSNEALLKFSKLFEDELTLDNLSIVQLRALCRIVNIPPVGPENMLRFQLRMKLRTIKADDRLIRRDGLHSLSVSELQNACRDRGMRALGLSEDRLKTQLSQWLELSLNEKVPPALLLLSRTLYLPEDVSYRERLNIIIKELPDNVALEANMKLSELEGEKVDNKAKLDIIKSIEKALRDQRKKEKEEEKQRQREQKLAEQPMDVRALESPEPSVSSPSSGMELSPSSTPSIPISAPAPVPSSGDPLPPVAPEPEPPVDKLLKEIEEAIDTVRGDKEQVEDLAELKDDVQEYKEDVEEVTALSVLKGSSVLESKAAKLLQSKVDRMIGKIDKLTNRLDERKRDVKEREELPPEEKKEELIQINELLLAMHKLRKLDTETKAQKVVEVLQAMDEDQDGAISPELALQVIELLAQENVNTTSEQMKEIARLLRREQEEN